MCDILSFGTCMYFISFNFLRCAGVIKCCYNAFINKFQAGFWIQPQMNL